MNRRDVLATCVVALGVTGIALAFFSPQPVCAKGPAEGSKPRITAATANYQGCTVSIRLEDPKNPNGKITLECENPTSKMVDFPAVITWNTQSVASMESRVALPVKMPNDARPNSRPIRCIAFPRSTASFDIPLPQLTPLPREENAGPRVLVQAPALTINSTMQLQVQMGSVVLQGPWMPSTVQVASPRQPVLTKVAVNRR